MVDKLGIGEIRIKIKNMIESTEDGSIKEIVNDKYYVVIEGHDQKDEFDYQNRFEVMELVFNAIKPKSCNHENLEEKQEHTVTVKIDEPKED